MSISMNMNMNMKSNMGMKIQYTISKSQKVRNKIINKNIWKIEGKSGIWIINQIDKKLTSKVKIFLGKIRDQKLIERFLQKG